MPSCKHHPNAHLHENEDGEEVCSKCCRITSPAYVNTSYHSASSQGNSFDDADGTVSATEQCRVGAVENPLLNGEGLSTVIGGCTGSAGFNEDGVAKYKNRHAPMTASARALTKAFNEIEDMASRMNLPPNMTTRANELFKEVFENPLLKKCSKSGIAAACLYFSCREQGAPRTFREMIQVSVSAVTRKELGRCFKQLDECVPNRLPILNSEDFIPRFCGTLGVPLPIQQAADTIARRALLGIACAGRTPITIAAAAIYMASQASDTKYSHKQISEVTGVNPATIRQTYQEMYYKAKILFPKDFNFVVPIKYLPLG